METQCRPSENISKDDFILVTRKNRRKGSKCKKNVATNTSIYTIEDDVEIDIEDFIQKLQGLTLEVKESDYITDFKVILEKVLKKFSTQSTVSDLSIVCYGIGKFVSSKTSRYQLIFLKLLKDVLKVEVYVYDPAFSEKEIEILRCLSLHVLSHNEEAKRTVTEPTFFYMPHCEHGLYNNLLWANWNIVNLRHVIVIGNSLKSMSENMHEAKRTFIFRSTDFVDERRIPNSFRFKDIFSDTSIHLFDYQKLLLVAPEIWLDKDEPTL